jgi:hypothetical protein
MNLKYLGSSADWLRWLVCSVAITMAGGCNSQTSPAAKAAPVNASAPAADTTPKAHNLTMYGYNYTDTEIGSFEVNGQGGGNLQPSTLTAGGGKSVCCIAFYMPMSKPLSIKIKWTRDIDTWCEQEVTLRPTSIVKPKYFEVHFYPDGHIELAVTEESSDPRLQLEAASEGSRHQDRKRNINNDTKFARCKLGYS